MPVGRDKRSGWRRALEYLLYGVALALPLLYFASRYPPFEAWFDRVQLRNPIVLEQPGADRSDVSGDDAPSAQPRVNRVYRCLNEGEVVLSDRPCGNVVETREIGPGDVNVMPSTAFTGAPALPEDVDCETLEARLSELDSRRRGADDERAAQVALERDAAWQQGRSAGCW
jgi:hypothetical protein